ncbi:aldehyde dehydrogenase family protein [Kribbia dieselivorans]|uniref:aldehyde dehydrogenase family protein n=1 Tax=Kribbia dieselivorans TaxID=331526 RepID=UPI000838EAE6|nr:aldehyde dehydrogenase family protein [Kribbia dieselivorans]
MTSDTTVEVLEPQHVSAGELQRILTLQRDTFRQEGFVSAAVRRDRVARVAVTILENIDEIAQTLSLDYGFRPPELTKAFETTAWVPDVQATLASLESWMEPTEIPGGFIQNKPLGVVGVIGAWNFPVILAFEPAMAALAAGNRVMLNFSEFHVRTGHLLAKLFAEAIDESVFAIVTGDLETARSFSELPFDHLFFTGSPGVGRLIAQAAAKNLTPVTLELGGKNPVVVARSADLDLAAHRIAGTRALNSGQICLCPDYVFVPRELKDEFVDRLRAEFSALLPDVLDNPGVVSIVNDRNFQRVTGLVDDAVQQGATSIVVAPEAELASLPDAATRRIAPTILLDVPATARIADEEIFGPVLPIYVYDDVSETIEYVRNRPNPLGAYWYGEDDDEFRAFLDGTTSGGVTRNDGIAHALLPGAPFGGVGNSGSGAYHGKTGFDTFTHRRAVANVTQERGIAEGLNGRALLDEGFLSVIDQTVTDAAASFRQHFV